MIVEKKNGSVSRENPVTDIRMFVTKKVKLLDKAGPWQTAMLAKLRRGIGKEPGELPELWEVTLDSLPGELLSARGEASRGEWAVHTVLTLYALHRQGKNASMNCKGVSLGKAMAQLRTAENEESLKRRFDAVLTSKDFTEIARHARGVVQLLKAADVRLDYPKLACDLYLFQSTNTHTKNKVRLRWGQDYYRLKRDDERHSEDVGETDTKVMKDQGKGKENE